MMNPNKKNAPVIPPDAADTDDTREPTEENLLFNEDENSFELDVETEDPEYEHPEPYDTVAPNGEDDNSTYDEANQYTPNEYRDKRGELKGEFEDLDREISNHDLKLNRADKELAHNPEDERGDLDEEGYPLNDDPGGNHNPILEDSDETSNRPDDESEVKAPPFEDPRGNDNEPIGDGPNKPIEPQDLPPPDERDPLGDKQIQKDNPTETTG